MKVVLVGNKMDLNDKRVVSTTQGANVSVWGRLEAASTKAHLATLRISLCNSIKCV